MWCLNIQLLLTWLGQQSADLVGQQMCYTGVEVVNGLLHGLYPEAQCVSFSLQHGILLIQVAVALWTLLTCHTLPLHKEANILHEQWPWPWKPKSILRKKTILGPEDLKNITDFKSSLLHILVAVQPNTHCDCLKSDGLSVALQATIVVFWMINAEKMLLRKLRTEGDYLIQS